jgi:hypothetical protein
LAQPTGRLAGHARDHFRVWPKREINDIERMVPINGILTPMFDDSGLAMTSVTP